MLWMELVKLLAAVRVWRSIHTLSRQVLSASRQVTVYICCCFVLFSLVVSDYYVIINRRCIVVSLFHCLLLLLYYHWTVSSWSFQNGRTMTVIITRGRTMQWVSAFGLSNYNKWQPIQADSQPKSSGLVLGRRPLGAVLHSSNKPGELSQWLCHDDSTIDIVLELLLLLFMERGVRSAVPSITYHLLYVGICCVQVKFLKLVVMISLNIYMMTGRDRMCVQCMTNGL